ncbi:MCE family protein [Rhodococcoides kroppenstedtii]|nr:MCE family protein [Rhodococcus kroppenstedtii]
MALGLVGMAVGTVLAYRGTVRDLVSPPVLVTVESDRAGLVMDPGALVVWHGVEVGTVTAVRTRAGGAALHVSLDAETVRDVPANIGARIAATTVFGAKTVTLVDPPHPAAASITSGSVVEASSVTVETNTVFESLRSVLVAAQPDKLNTTLGAVSTALAGRGGALGTTLDDAAEVLGATAPLTATLERAVDDAATVAGTAADAAPDLTTLLASATTTARTVTDRRSALETALTAMTGTATTVDRVIGANADGWSSTLETARPTSSLLQRYSPMLSCFLQGADIARIGAEKVSGGNGRTMLLNSTVLFGVPPYRYETDLPRVAASGGPRCGALPLVQDSAIPTPYVVADTGSNPFRAGNRSPVLEPNSIIDLLPEGLTAPRPTR